MNFATQTSAGPLELDLTRAGGGVLVRVTATEDTWNSIYTPVPLASFLADFARVPEEEAAAIAERVLDDWKASPESGGPDVHESLPKAATAAVPGLVLTLVTVVAFGVIAYIVVRSLLGATT